jgi:hypothetical protein
MAALYSIESGSLRTGAPLQVATIHDVVLRVPDDECLYNVAMKNLTIAFVAAVSLLSAAGCKKKADTTGTGSAGSADVKAPEPTATGSAATTPSMAGSGSATAPAATGSATPDTAGSGSAAAPSMAGSGSAGGSN